MNKPSRELRAVAGAARKRADADRALRAAIRTAAAAGLSYRTIATAAGLSHEHVRRIAQKEEL